MSTTLEAVKKQYGCSQNNYSYEVYNQATIHKYPENKICIAELDNKKLSMETKQTIEKIKKCQEANQLDFCVQIKYVYDENGEYAIVMELGNCDLQEELDRNPNMSFVEKLAIQYQLCQSIGQLSEKEIIHSDVKAANFIKFQDQERTQYKLADFGLCQSWNRTCTSKSGTIFAPEQQEDEYNNEFIDVYALGITFKQMITKEISSHQEYAHLIERLTDPDPNNRLKIEQAEQQLKDILTKLQKITLFRLIELSFSYNQRTCFLKDNFNNKYCNFQFEFAFNQGQPYANTNILKKKGDVYKTIQYTQPYLFNSTLKADIRIDQDLDNILSLSSNIDQGRPLIKFLFILSNLIRTQQKEIISSEEINACIINSCGYIEQLSTKKEYDVKQVQSQVLYAFYTPQRLKITNANEIDLIELIRKIIKCEQLNDMEIEWVFEKKEAHKKIKINQNICADCYNRCFIFIKTSQQDDFYKSTPHKIVSNLLYQFIDDLNLQSLVINPQDPVKTDKYSCYITLINQFMILRAKGNYLNTFENAFLIQKTNIKDKQIKIKFLDQFIMKLETDQQWQECEQKLSSYLCQFDKDLNQSNIQEQKNFIRNYLYTNSVSIQNLQSSEQQIVPSILYSESRTQQIRIQQQSLEQFSNSYYHNQRVKQWLIDHKQGEQYIEKQDYDANQIQKYSNVQVVIFKDFPSQELRQCIDIIRNNEFTYCMNIFEVFETPQFTLITELLNTDHLLAIIKKAEFQALYTKLHIMYQLSLSLQELHLKNISHQDLKLQCFTYLKQNSQNIYKLSDYSKCIASNELSKNTDIEQLRQIFYQILTKNYDSQTNLDNIDQLSKDSIIAQIQQKYKQRLSHLDELIQVLFKQQPLNTIIQQLKSNLIKFPEIKLYKTFKIKFVGDDLMDNFGNKYTAYKVTYFI